MTNTTDLDPREVGEWMLLDGLVAWEQYDDFGKFQVTRLDNGYRIYDPDEMDAAQVITFSDFFKHHKNLIWEANIPDVRHDWIGFAFKANGAEPDEYDAITTDVVLQHLLYGKVIYG